MHRLSRRALWACAAVLLLGSALAEAQLSERDLQDTGQADAEVADVLDGSRVQDEIIYLRPDATFEPDQSVEIDVPEEEAEAESDGRLARWVWGAIFAIILLAVIAVIVSQGGAVGVSFGRQVSEGRRAQDHEEAEPDEFDALNRQPLDQFLNSLRGMADKRMALILLVSRALERAADQNEVRLGRAQTARDVVRVLPAGWPHLAALRGLVREAEVVHFGGRDVSEETWQACFTAAQPIFERRRAA